MSGVKSGVEAGNLGHVGQSLCGSVNSGQIVRLVARGQRTQFGNAGANAPVDNHRSVKPFSAVNNAVADTRYCPGMRQDDLIDQPWQHLGVTLVRVAKLLLLAGRRFKSWRLAVSDCLDQSGETALEFSGEHRKLDRRRAAIERQQVIARTVSHLDRVLSFRRRQSRIFGRCYRCAALGLIRNRKFALAWHASGFWPDRQTRTTRRKDCAQQVFSSCQGAVPVLSFGQK
jgi:hypothetical protein